MVNPPEPPTIPKPHISELGLSPQMFSPEVSKEAPSNYASPILPTRRTSFQSSMTSISTSSKKNTNTSSVVSLSMEKTDSANPAPAQV